MYYIKNQCIFVAHILEYIFTYAFEGFPFIVADSKGNFYQLPHCTNNRTKVFRKLKLTTNNNVTLEYRINRKFISLRQLRKKAIHKVQSYKHIVELDVDCPF